MQHFLVEYQQLSDITTAFPHSPASTAYEFAISFQDYFEDKRANGYELVSVVPQSNTNGWWFTFKVVAK